MEVGRVSEELLPVFLVDELTQNILHVLALFGELPQLPLLGSEGGVVLVVGVDRVPGPVPEDFVDHQQLSALNGDQYEEEDAEEPNRHQIYN